MSGNTRPIRRRQPPAPTNPAEDEPREEPPKAEPPVQEAPKREPHRKLDPSDLEAIASMSMADMAELMDANSGRSKVEVGDRVTGVITRVGADNVFVDVGAKAEAMLERDELPEARLGESITAFVVDVDDNGGIHLSRRLSGSAAAGFLEEAVAAGVPVEGQVAGRNPGGFDVRIGSVRAFCPFGQIDRHPDSTDPDAWIGQTLEFKVLEAGDRVVISRRALQEAGMGDKRDAFWLEAAIGQTRRGTITSVQPFGVFVDLDGVDGLVPKRELSWEDEVDASAYKRGQPLDVRIIDLDHEHRKVTLSARDQAASPWTRVGVDFQQGGVYEGKVVRLETYGAFVELAPGLQGLLHTSRAGRARPKPGERIQVRLQAIDSERQRLELAAADLDEQSAAAGTDTPGAIVKGTVQQVLKNGLVVDLEDGSSGWVPAKEIDLPAGTLLAQRFRPGKEIQARVVDTDPSRRRSNLSLRLEPEVAWRGQTTSAGPTSMGTFADLFKGFKPKK